MLTIDGAQGEGGGQIVRTSLALSIITATPFEIAAIRAGRAKPGLKRQHLTAIGAAREICGGNVSGVDLGSDTFTFAPGPIQTRHFKFGIAGAGSSTLVAQTVLPALMMADKPSTITVEGGTHNSGAPPYDFLAKTYLPQVAKLGPKFTATLGRHGFVPVGGGELSIEIEPVDSLKGLDLMTRDNKVRPRVTALLSRLDEDIGHRETAAVARKMGWAKSTTEVVHVESPGPGNVVMVDMDCGNICEVVTGFGRRGLNAKIVAKNVSKEALAYLASDAPVGEYLADQLLLPMALAASKGQTSRFVTGALSEHSTTNMDVIRAFLDVRFTVEPLQAVDNESVMVTVES